MLPDIDPMEPTEFKKVFKLADRVEDVRYETVKSTLENALQYAQPGDHWESTDFVPTRCVLVFVDERAGKVRYKQLQSAGKLSDTIALLEIAKNRVLNEMFGN